MNQKAEGTSKIINPERIARILARMCEGRMQVLLRTKDNIKLGIRANFTKFMSSKNSPQIQFDKISNFGMEKLSPGLPIKIEVIGMPSKVMFVTTISQVSPNSIICTIPNSLVTIERRASSRQGVTQKSMAFLSFSVWAPEENDPAAPPFFEAYRPLANLVPIMDISTSGICIQSHFPSFINALDQIEVDPQAKLHLPMSPPIFVQAAIRWRRRIKNRINEDNQERYQLDFRAGIEFLEIKEDQQLKIRNFLRVLSLSDAI